MRGIQAGNDETAHRLRSYWKPAGVKDEVRHAAIRGWMARHGLSAVSTTLFLRARKYSAQRSQALRALEK